MRISVVFLILFCCFSLVSFSQTQGCTDPQALNYDPGALVNDGSCVYPATSVVPEIVVNPLPQLIRETSGLIFWNGGLWTQNDSGNDPVLYKIDTLSGQILQTVTVSGAENVDWEDLAQDDSHIYIGDFGNNNGNRTDLKIYITNKADFPVSGNGAVTATGINFSYGDQQVFKRARLDNDYDCEAFISCDDSLYLFTKNWISETTRLYALPKIPGTYQVFPLDTFNVNGLITGADVRTDSSAITLVGYKDYKPFIWLLFDFQGRDFFGGNKRRIDFESMFATQTEGVSYTYGDEIYISSEKTVLVPSLLMKLNTAAWTQTQTTGFGLDSLNTKGLLIYPNPNNGRFWLGFPAEKGDQHYLAEVVDCLGTCVWNDEIVSLQGETTELTLGNLRNGLYLLRLAGKEVIYSGKFIVNQKQFPD